MDSYSLVNILIFYHDFSATTQHNSTVLYLFFFTCKICKNSAMNMQVVSHSYPRHSFSCPCVGLDQWDTSSCSHFRVGDRDDCILHCLSHICSQLATFNKKYKPNNWNKNISASQTDTNLSHIWNSSQVKNTLKLS